jgi:hypothetical protein
MNIVEKVSFEIETEFFPLQARKSSQEFNLIGKATCRTMKKLGLSLPRYERKIKRSTRATFDEAGVKWTCLLARRQWAGRQASRNARIAGRRVRLWRPIFVLVSGLAP